MFGATLRDHEMRYEYAQEWLDVIKLAWSPREDFDFDGQFIKLRGVRVKPKPYGGTRPLIMHAGASPTGQSFAIRNKTSSGWFVKIKNYPLFLRYSRYAHAREIYAFIERTNFRGS